MFAMYVYMCLPYFSHPTWAARMKNKSWTADTGVLLWPSGLDDLIHVVSLGFRQEVCFPPKHTNLGSDQHVFICCCTVFPSCAVRYSSRASAFGTTTAAKIIILDSCSPRPDDLQCQQGHQPFSFFSGQFCQRVDGLTLFVFCFLQPLLLRVSHSGVSFVVLYSSSSTAVPVLVIMDRP